VTGLSLARFLRTALESSVNALLKSAKLRGEGILHTEGAMLQMNEFPVEDVTQRRGEFRKMEIIFRAEVCKASV
jgi:hypothetical protein